MVSIEVVLFLVAFVLAITRFVLQRRKTLPGPFQWPFVGNVKEISALFRKLGGIHEAMLEISRRYKSPVIKVKLGGENLIVVSGVEYVNAVLNSDVYEGRPWNYFIELGNMGKRKGITMNDGPVWREIRSWFVRSMRSLGLARREMSDILQEELADVLKNIGDGGVMQIKPLIIPVIINVLWTFATGKKFDKKTLKHFIDLMDRRSQAFDVSGGILSAFPWLRFIAPEWSGYNLMISVNKEFEAILMKTINEHKKNYVRGSNLNLIDMFLNEMYAGRGPEAGFDDDELMIIMLDVLLARLNITTATLDFLFLNILLHQDSQKKVHEEIDRVIGREKLPENSDRPNMPFTEATIIENQRLVLVAPLIGPRRVLLDTKLLGCDVPRESVVLINVHSINVDPDLYPEPYRWRPERHLKNGLRIRDENLLFFGKGRRQCPGVSLAKSVLFQIFTGVLQRFELLPAPGREPPSFKMYQGITLSPKPYDVLFKPRNKVS